MGSAEEKHNVKVIGSGEEVVVLGHGFGTDQSVWDHVTPHLINDYRVVLYDNMGAATTNPNHFDIDRYSSLDGHAFDLLAILDELKINFCIFVGHSVAAMAGAIASVTRPDLFKKLIFLNASPRYLNDTDYCGGFRPADLYTLFLAMESDYHAWCIDFAPRVLGHDPEKHALQEFSRTLSKMRPDIAVRFLRVILEGDLRQALAKVTVTCHVLQTEKDMTVPITVPEAIRGLLGSDCFLEIIKSEGHLPQLSSPGTVIPVLLKHIRNDIANIAT